MRTILELFIKYIDVISILLVGIFAVSNLFTPGFFPSHDGEYHVIRFYEFDKTLREGNWYPLWATDLNYTYGLPLFNYVYPLPNYVSSALHLFEVSFVDSFKFNLIIASIIGSITSYIYGRERFGRWGAVLVSVFYTMAPYHLLDIYIRGSVGEVWSLALFPLCLYLFDKLAEGYKTQTIAVASITYSLIIFSHNILALMFTFFLVFYSIFLIFEKKNKNKIATSIILTLIGGLGLSSIFIVPAIFEQEYVTGLKIYDVLQNFPEIYQLIIPSWGSGFSGTSSLSQMSFQIGIANLIVVLLVLARIFKKNQRNNLIIFYLSSFFLLTFMLTPYSAFIWQRIELMQYFQFPWRILSLVILCAAVLAGSITKIYKSRIIYVALLAFVFLTTFSYAKAPYFWNRDDNHYISRENFIYGSNSVGDAFQTKWLNQQKKLPILDLEIKLTENSTAFKEFAVSARNNRAAIFPVSYFPGWKVRLNGVETQAINNEGKVEVKIPKGNSIVQLRLEDTAVRLIAKAITILTAMIILLALFKIPVIQYFYARSHR